MLPQIKYLVLLLFFVSCGSIKKHKESTEVDTSLNANTEVKLDYERDSYTLAPVDLTRPILVGGKEYHNTIIRVEKETGVEETKQKVEERTEVKEEVKDKESDNTKLFLGVFAIGFLFLFICLVFVIIYFSRQLKPLVSTLNVNNKQ